MEMVGRKRSPLEKRAGRGSAAQSSSPSSSPKLSPRSAESPLPLPRRWAGGPSVLLVVELLKLKGGLVCGPRQATVRSCHVGGLSYWAFPLLQKRLPGVWGFRRKLVPACECSLDLDQPLQWDRARDGSRQNQSTTELLQPRPGHREPRTSSGGNRTQEKD